MAADFWCGCDGGGVFLPHGGVFLPSGGIFLPYRGVFLPPPKGLYASEIPR